MRQEWFARILVVILLAAAIAIPIIGWRLQSQGTLIHARMAETGGWLPENLVVTAGQPVHLRLTSDDVTHGFAVGQSDQPAVDVYPGEVTEITLLFEKPGKYTFYCTRWCSVNHWRMRGVIEVRAPAGQPGGLEAAEPALYVQLGLDIDAVRQTSLLPAQTPSAKRGAAYGVLVSAVYLDRDYYLAHSPAETWQTLRREIAFKNLSDQSVWDLTAWIWQQNTRGPELEEGQSLYAVNCAACHGEQGRGDGIFADELARGGGDDHTDTVVGAMTTQPVRFTDAGQMLAASPALLQGKIIRGGMGTGMPYWGPILSDEQTWALVAYLWTFQFELEEP